MAKFIRIAQWNANGLQSHKEEIKLFLIQNFIDILLISETHFTDRNYFNIPRYKLYQTNHPDGTAHGGTAILIKENIEHYELPRYEENHIQATSIKVKGFPHETSISAVYCPPRHNIKREQFVEFFDTLGPTFIAGGDYNSKHTLWGSRLITTKGRELAHVIQENNLSFLSTGTPTYWPTDNNKIPDLLDFFVTKGISSTYTDITASYDLTSDHSPIIATVSTSIKMKKPTPRLHNTKTNWDRYRLIIQSQVNLSIRLQEQADIETETNNYIKLLQFAAKEATPNSTSPTPNTQIPIEIKKLIAKKRKARSTWQRTHTPDDRRKYMQKSNELKSKLNEMRNRSFEKYISNLTRQDNSIWKPIKNAKKPKTTSSPIRKYCTPPGPWAKSDKQKADLFAEHLSQVFTPHDDDKDQEIEEQLNAATYVQQRIKSISLSEIKEEIKMLNPKKSPGLDLITAKMLKELPDEGLRLLMYLFNAIIRLEYWPKALKIAQIIMIPKPGKDVTNITSYRPISLLSTISKLLEKIILKRINTDIDTHDWMPDHQFGFRQSHSTIQQCHRIVDVINKSMENSQYCTAVFLDVSQAFDKVWHPGLLFKIKRNLPKKYFNLLKSYLNQREFLTKVNGETSNRFPILSGVPQGSILGPLLYVLYTSDLPTSEDITTGTFADDTALISTNTDPNTASHNLQEHLSSLETWLKKWKIKVNESKSSHITFTLRKERCPTVTINQETIPQADAVKYLGLHLDSKLNWKEHITKKRKQIDLKVKEIYWLIGRKSKLSIENKLLIYKSIIRPIWTYGVELWGCAAKSHIAIMQRAQSKILRTITDAPWYVSNHTLHTDLNIPYIREVIQDKIHQHHNKLEVHTNPLLETLLQPMHNRRLKRCWPSDLNRH